MWSVVNFHSTWAIKVLIVMLQMTVFLLLWNTETVDGFLAPRILSFVVNDNFPMLVNKGDEPNLMYCKPTNIVFRTNPSTTQRRNRMQIALQEQKNPNIFDKKDDDQRTTIVYSRDVRLREEVESPFRKVRYFLYWIVGGGAVTSLFVSLARILAATVSGINTDLLEESIQNVVIDITGLVVMVGLYQRDRIAEESRLARASKGAELAKLTIRASKRLLLGLENENERNQDNVSTFTTTLASLRRGRGIEKRVVIAVAGKEKIKQVLQDAKELEDDLILNDLLVVPVVLPHGTAPSSYVTGGEGEEGPASSISMISECVAFPVTTSNN